ncbi:MAG: hypothetical protein ABFS24_12370 [Pseudomonadota bacterium]
MGAMRKPFFIVALVLMVLVVLLETGASFFLDADAVGAVGLGIPYLALLDGLLLFGVGLIGLGLILPDRLQGRVQGILTLVVSFLMLLLSLVMIYVALALLMLMVSLLMAVPFGTAVYFAKYADFNTGTAAITLSTIMGLKLGFAVFLLLAHERFLEMKSLVFMLLTSLLASVIVSFLHGFAPAGFLVSITDDIAAIIIAILAVIWALYLLISSIPAVIKALRVDRALSS